MQASNEVDVLARQLRKSCLGAQVLHEHRVADFEKPAAVAVGVAVWPIRGIVGNLGKLEEDLRVGPAGLTDRHRLRGTSPAPPTLAFVVEEDAAITHAH